MTKWTCRIYAKRWNPIHIEVLRLLVNLIKIYNFITSSMNTIDAQKGQLPISRKEDWRFKCLIVDELRIPNFLYKSSCIVWETMEWCWSMLFSSSKLLGESMTCDERSDTVFKNVLRNTTEYSENVCISAVGWHYGHGIKLWSCISIWVNGKWFIFDME